jgi:hypothetical protein
MRIPAILFSAACLANEWYAYHIQNKTPYTPWTAQDNQLRYIVAWVIKNISTPLLIARFGALQGVGNILGYCINT